MLTLEQLVDIAIKADAALERMKLALPTDLTAGVRLLASALPCHAGTCSERRR